MTDTLIDIAQQAVEQMRKAGADKADAVLFDAHDITVCVRMGKAETLESSTSKGLGLRAMVRGDGGFCQAMIATSDISPATLSSLANEVVSMARIVPADPYNDIPASQTAATMPDLALHDTTQFTAEQLLEDAQIMEEAALAHPDIHNSDGAESSVSQSEVALATSEGFIGSYRSSHYARSASVIAGTGLEMETDYAYSATRQAVNLRATSAIGAEAAQRAADRLHAKPAPSGNYPILFNRRCARSLVGTFLGALNGASVARGTSFLQDRLGQSIASTHLTITDTPHVIKGMASEPFDGEGLIGPALTLVDQGILQHWLLDTRCANQLGMQSNGRASRDLSSAPSPATTNVDVTPGSATPEALLEQMGTGLLLTDAFGMGINLVTGDYSQGAAGFWVENGQIMHPVNGITIASSLQDMLKTIIPANDTTTHHATNSPSLLVDGMMVA